MPVVILRYTSRKEQQKKTIKKTEKEGGWGVLKEEPNPIKLCIVCAF